MSKVSVVIPPTPMYLDEAEGYLWFEGKNPRDIDFDRFKNFPFELGSARRHYAACKVFKGDLEVMSHFDFGRMIGLKVKATGELFHMSAYTFECLLKERP